jgi:hypothetical protein
VCCAAAGHADGCAANSYSRCADCCADLHIDAFNDGGAHDEWAHIPGCGHCYNRPRHSRNSDRNHERDDHEPWLSDCNPGTGAQP